MCFVSRFKSPGMGLGSDGVMSYHVNRGHTKYAGLGAAVAVVSCIEGLRRLFRGLLKLDVICV